MATQNIGTLVGSAIRPIDDLIPIASAYGNEVKGGHHTYATSAERNAIIEPRREWNMLCTVYNDGTNNGTYILKYNKYSVTITDNQNWVLFDSTMNSSLEWVNSVISVVDNSSSATTTNGNRYLIIGGSGLFTGHGNEIVTWDSSTTGGVGAWIFTTPSTGYTLRVDDQPGVIFRYDGSSWVKEYNNQVRYLSALSGDGLAYTATTSSQEVVSFYTQSVYYVNFATTNSGTASIDIDGKGISSIKKISGTSLVDLTANDLVVGLEYQLIYNEVNSVFQTIIGGGGSNVIGPAEDGDYTDGLFTDFTTSTPIGTPIDRFNEILKALVPPSAPNLNSWSASGSFVSGKLSFNGSDFGFSSGTQSTILSTDKNGAFNASGYRLGIMSGVSGNAYNVDINGVLNSGVAVHTSTPIPAYAANSFGNGITGSIYMNVNGVTISSINLASTYGPIDTTTGGATSGVSITAATSSKFPSGYEFTNFWNRTGTWILKKNYPGMLSGYNYVVISHVLPATSYVLSRYEFIYDIASQSTSVSSPSFINSPNLSGTKKLSGIGYYTVGNVRYNYSMDNIYKNTFNSSTSALTFVDSTGPVTNGVYGVESTETAAVRLSPSLSSISIPDLGVGEGPSKVLSGFMTFSVASSVRMINDTLSLRMSALRTVQGSFTGATATLANCFIDNYPISSTRLTEYFDDEEYRIINKGLVKYDPYYNVAANATSAGAYWDSDISLYDGTFYDYDNGLQVINGAIIYPRFNFHSVGLLVTNPNYTLVGTSLNYYNCSSITHGLPRTDHGSSTNYRTYTRYFDISSLGTRTSVNLVITYTNCTFVNSTYLLSGFPNYNNVWLEFKLPRGAGAVTADKEYDPTYGYSVTGWMDATKTYNGADPNNWKNGSGCWGSSGTIPASGVTWPIIFGSKSTANSDNIILIRITAGPSWTGSIKSITIS
jgi:hypothetical protein